MADLPFRFIQGIIMRIQKMIFKRQTFSQLMPLLFDEVNGFGNIVDDARILVYDLTAIFSGIGFIVISKTK